MDIITPLLLSSLIVIGDYKSTTNINLRSSNHELIELSPIKNQEIRAVVQGVIIAGGDILVQKKAPKYKWYYRASVIAVGAFAIGNNLSQGKRLNHVSR